MGIHLEKNKKNKVFRLYDTQDIAAYTLSVT